ncbi:MAG TPA: hypothetical protein VIH04_05280 [Nitrosarchaeum sp.]
MNYKNAITMTTLSVIAVFAIMSFAGFEIADTDAAPAAPQPSKFVFAENISATAEFKFRDGTELAPITYFIQTGGFGTSIIEGTSRSEAEGSGEKSGRTKPSFTLEKSVGNTPYLYEAADQAQKYIVNSGFEHPYKFFDVTVYLNAGGIELRSFEYRDCQMKNYVVTTRADNEEAYSGKTVFAIVDQFAFECDGYTPQNPAMDQMKVTHTAKTISSSDLRSTDKWEPGFSVKP